MAMKKNLKNKIRYYQTETTSHYNTFQQVEARNKDSKGGGQNNRNPWHLNQIPRASFQMLLDDIRRNYRRMVALESIA